MISRLLEVFAERRVDGHELVIDGHSPDGNDVPVDEIAAREPRGADLIVEMDSDDSRDPAVIPQLVTGAGAADVVSGARYVPDCGTENWGVVRKAISRAGCISAHKALGIAVCDLTGGFTCFRRDVFATIPLDEVGGPDTSPRSIWHTGRSCSAVVSSRSPPHSAIAPKACQGRPRKAGAEAALHLPRWRWQPRQGRRQGRARAVVALKVYPTGGGGPKREATSSS